MALVNSVNPVRLEGQKTAAFEIVDFLGDAPDFHLLPVGNAGNISAYWKGYTRVRRPGPGDPAPRVMRGFQAEGAAPLVTGRAVPDPETVATAIRIGNPASWQLAESARDESGGRFDAVSDDQILAAQRELAARDGVFVEPASAAGVAGLLQELAAGGVLPRQDRGRHRDRTRTQGHRHRARGLRRERPERRRHRHRGGRRGGRSGRRARLSPAMAIFVEGPVQVTVPPPRPTSDPASTPWASRSPSTTTWRPRSSGPGCRSRWRAPAPTTYPATNGTSSSDRCAPPSSCWVTGRPGCA